MPPIREGIDKKLRTPGAERILYIKYALENGLSLDDIFALTKIDRWFLSNMAEIVEFENKLKTLRGKQIPTKMLIKAKVMGFSDNQLARFWGIGEEEARNLRKEKNVMPHFKQVDTCAAEFEAYTPYYYSTYS